MIKQFLFLMILITAMASCRSSKIINTTAHKAVTEKTSTENAIDTSKKITVENSIIETDFGDTLIGTASFTDEQITQMESSFTKENIEELESNGVKVSVSLKQFKGGIKAKIKAIAKPVSNTNTTQKTTTETLGKEVKKEQKEIATITEKQKAVEVKGFPYKTLIISSIIAAVIVVLMLTLIKKTT